MKIIATLRPFFFTIIIATACLLTQVFSPTSIEILRYQANEVSNGEIWRILTANFCHSNWNHLGLNITGLLLIDYLFQPFTSQLQRALLLSFCIIANVILLHLFLKLTWYVGLSGALHGYLVGGALISFKHAKKFAGAILLFVGGKLIAEMNWEINADTAKLIEANVVEEAHLFGAISAVLYYGLLKLKGFLTKI